MSPFNKLRTGATLLLTAIVALHLLWEQLHGGITTHYLLQRSDLPGISNWWGLLLMPAVGWITLGKIQHRMAAGSRKQLILLLFAAALLVGLSISVAFSNKYTPFLDNVPYLMLLLVLLVPVYRSEFILGFVLGMAYVFGVVLPTTIILAVAAVSFLVQRGTRSIIRKMGAAKHKAPLPRV